MTLMKAQLFKIESWSEGGVDTAEPKPYTTVQFNPASLKVTFSNQVKTDGQGTGSAMQYVGKGDSKLAAELIFDVSGEDATDARDVRRMTQKVAYFMTPAPAGNDEQDKPQYSVPGLRFQWGSFLFDGILVSMDETLELWSEDGNPLRATVSLSMAQPGIQFQFDKNSKATPPPENKPQSGTQALTPAEQGDSVQGLVANSKSPADWKTVATANGIENPRNLQPGTLVNLKVRAP